MPVSSAALLPLLHMQLLFLVIVTPIMHAFWDAAPDSPEQMGDLINFFKVQPPCSLTKWTLQSPVHFQELFSAAWGWGCMVTGGLGGRGRCCSGLPNCEGSGTQSCAVR